MANSVAEVEDIEPIRLLIDWFWTLPLPDSPEGDPEHEAHLAASAVELMQLVNALTDDQLIRVGMLADTLTDIYVEEAKERRLDQR